MTPSPTSGGPTIEQGIATLIADAKTAVKRKHAECEARVRKSPTAALAAATAAGYVLHRLPLRSILVTQARILTALAGPALLAYGAAKACELLQREARRRPPI